MKTMLRIPRGLHHEMLVDLRRPHPVAFERVGFLTTRATRMAENTLVLASTYLVVTDDDYLEDPTSGACINSHAITSAIQHVLTEQSGIFHVHLHDYEGLPWFSTTDQKDNPRIIQSCIAAGRQEAHGMLVLSRNTLAGLVWLPGRNTPHRLTRTTIVGYPTEILHHDK